MYLVKHQISNIGLTWKRPWNNGIAEDWREFLRQTCNTSSNHHKIQCWSHNQVSTYELIDGPSLIWTFEVESRHIYPWCVVSASTDATTGLQSQSGPQKYRCFLPDSYNLEGSECGFVRLKSPSIPLVSYHIANWRTYHNFKLGVLLSFGGAYESIPVTLNSSLGVWDH